MMMRTGVPVSFRRLWRLRTGRALYPVLAAAAWTVAVAGHGRQAARVSHISVERGDGLGYDILSFEPDTRERLIEV